jgi:PST family polysaccharide transporter
LPTYSKIKTTVGFRNEVFNFYKTIVPVFALGLIGIYFLRTFIVVFVFSDEFIPVEGLFGWQLLGDFVRLLSLVISYQLVAKKMFWQYIITETLSYVTLYFVSIYCIDEFGLKGVTMAHFLTYTIYYGIILMLFWKSLFGKLPKE